MKRTTRKRPLKRKKQLPIEVKTISDLIALAQNEEIYDKINTTMLWNILPQLMDIEELIGMKELKTSLFYQIIYYLQELNKGDEDSEYLHTVIMGTPGSGKCLGKGTPVFMYDGSVKCVEDIQVGDILIGDDLQKRNVLSTCSGNEIMYRICYSDSEEYIVNQSHILTLADSEYNLVDLSLTEYLNSNEKYYGVQTSLDFENAIEFDSDPFLEGYILINKINNVCVDLPDIVLEKLEKHISTDKDAMISIDSLLDIQKIYTREHLHLFLQGVFYFSNTVFLEDGYEFQFVKNALTTTGCQFKYTTKTHFIDDVESQFYSITCKNIPEYNPEPLITYHDIEVYKLDVGEYFGFELDGNNRFILGNGIVTHNTTIARIIGELYKNMGILSPNGVFRVAKREDLVAEYLGQTAIKTRKLLDSCKGGVLFIDEIYSLGPGVADKDSFSKEAIDTLNLYLSEHKHEFCCIVAGYEEEIQKCFFSVNPGLERRFQWIHRIHKYTIPELTDMFYKRIDMIGWETNIRQKDIEDIIRENESLFVHYGGDIENLVSKCKMAHAYNLMNKKGMDKYVINKLDLEDAIDMIKQNRLTKSDSMYFQHMYL